MRHPRAALGVRGEDGSASHRGPSLRRPVPVRVPASHSDAPARSRWVSALCGGAAGAPGSGGLESGMSAAAAACNSGHSRNRRGPNLLIPTGGWVMSVLIKDAGSRPCGGRPLAQALLQLGKNKSFARLWESLWEPWPRSASRCADLRAEVGAGELGAVVHQRAERLETLASSPGDRRASREENRPSGPRRQRGSRVTAVPGEGLGRR